jgi:hypothetical protein
MVGGADLAGGGVALRMTDDGSTDDGLTDCIPMDDLQINGLMDHPPLPRVSAGGTVATQEGKFASNNSRSSVEG